MKGFIFTEFLDMVAQKFSPAVVEEIIDMSDLPNEGAYTEIGTYDYKEILKLATSLSKVTGIPIPDLEVVYGQHLFNRFLDRYKKLMIQTNSTFEFLQHVDDHIHVEVKKLYPEAELPKFTCEVLNPNHMTMTYSSNHPFSKLAEGLMLGCAAHYGEKIKIESKDLGPTKEKEYNYLFNLTKE